MSDWLILCSGKASAPFNMALDEALLEAMSRLQHPVLRFYGWTDPAASFGYFQKYAEVEHATPLRPLIRRPTAGGIVPHAADWTYSLAFPTTDAWYGLRAEESYRGAHELVQAAFARAGVKTELAPEAKKAGAGQCFIGYERFDLLWHGRKIAGAAQRRNRLGLLIQGSVQPPPIGLPREVWEQWMTAIVQERHGVSLAPEPDAETMTRARALQHEKYESGGYNRKR